MTDTPDGPGPATVRRRLWRLLDQLRREHGHTQEDIRAAMESSQSKAQRIVNGTSSISPNELRVLLGYYQITPPDQVRHLLDMAHTARKRHWTSAYHTVATTSYRDLLGYEDDAQRITQYHPYLVPSLLQTADYARLLMNINPCHRADPQATDAQVELLRERQDRLINTPRQPTIRIVLDERALTPTSDRGVMRRQITRIQNLVPRLDLAVLTYDTATNARLVGPFTAHEFHNDLDPDLVYVDTPLGDVALIEDPEIVAGYQAAADTLYGRAARGEAAWRLLEKFADADLPVAVAGGSR
ncbi:helix-turn-helix transcriptional regulator [Micromonospora fiedleri]|uniref:Helix-turn-helix transcriptional regulator n=1 Tax=Micromonospora fiedleri TaxID=1157498 RepID=A0ABS1UUZ2_9ACTN|nr:helix-turn-helix transcriptional regulator [Micromonospora fiedleri]